MKCGCGGDITPGVGCQRFRDNPKFGNHVEFEEGLRQDSRGGIAMHLPPDQAVMLFHLEENGLTSKQAMAAIHGK